MAEDASKPNPPTDSPRTIPVGAPVQFFNAELANINRQKFEPYTGRAVELNKQGAGPYPALVVQAFDDILNLRVFAFGGDWIETSVPPKSRRNAERYWQPVA